VRGWDNPPSYPPSALSTVTLKATDSQLFRWEKLAKQKQMARGAFIALAADTYCLYLDALQQAHEEYDRAMHPERYR
jgi:hypothetical protein